ncbi:methyltransferase domain-containing protein [Pseudorhodoplanes sp.]|uniref:methyltransferase domain-containing protein n=1 Tax=Pseudorhodoplanes sp. TaxID=1934341 RepID=UPI00391BAD5B
MTGVSAASSPFWPAGWRLDAFEGIERMNGYFQGERLTRYPLRFLRYWFVRHLIEAHAGHLGRPVDVLEVGVDRGQMLTFMKPRSDAGRPAIIRRWDAVDIACDPEQLAAKGYTQFVRFNVEHGAQPPLERRYDVIVFLHLLEHLQNPEACLRAFLPFLLTDGLMVGGSPTMPKVIADLGYERRLRQRARKFGHVSIMSPERLELFAQAEGLRLRFLSGSYLTRNNGRFIENSALWLRANIAFGSLFPSLGSEVNFCMSR